MPCDYYRSVSKMWFFNDTECCIYINRLGEQDQPSPLRTVYLSMVDSDNGLVGVLVVNHVEVTQLKL